MSEKDPRGKGKSRKDKGQTTSQPEETPTAQQSEVAQSSQGAGETPVENPVEQATHRFMKAVYKEGSDVLQALSAAQDDLFVKAGITESFQALYSITTLGLEEAQERNDQGLIDALTSKQRAFSSAIKRLNPLPQAAGGTQGPTNPSNLPPMTGGKGLN